jgi:serine phosphatase RsbU (regulator of sigma subunit)/CHASE3 domain sensor protein
LRACPRGPEPPERDRTHAPLTTLTWATGGYGFGMSLRLRVLCGFAVAIIGGVIAILQIFRGLHQTHTANQAVTDRWTPAAAASNRLLSHLVDQETGERGYLITGDAKFLQPYTEGRTETTQDLALIRTLSGDVPAISTSLTSVESQWQLWLTNVAEPEIATRQTGNVTQTQQLVDRSQDKPVFDDLRTKVATLQQDISTRATTARTTETGAIRRLERTLIAASIIAIGFTLLSLALIGVGVLRPLTALQRRLRMATEGAFRNVIPERGPPELREVARDAELMRRRLLRELDQSESARQGLEQRGTVVLGLSERLRLDDLAPIAGLQIASALHAAEGVVAGDLLDVVQIDDCHVGLVIADVSGHGATAGLEAITLKDVIGTALRLGRNPAQALEVAADQARLDERFATCAIVVINVKTGELTYANAGHLPPVVVPARVTALTPADLVSLEPTGPLLSVLARGWDVGWGQLAPGEVLLLVTDGLLEARTVEGDEFGMTGLCNALRSDAPHDAASVVSALTDAARTYAANYRRDDVTVLAVMRDLVTIPETQVTLADPEPTSLPAEPTSLSSD